ncbi:MAG: FKBP-type peptidyl-prolyl cis-trans isomerase [Planctomycetota bacterium]|nr:FKBP-type peptidyl-prolyl cis-trans isomerase [Planctomycetota bacterium]
MLIKKQLAVMIMLVLCLPAFAQDTPDKEIKEESVGKRGSYAFGVSFMKNMKSQSVPLDIAAFIQGMQDVSNDKVTLSEEQLQAAFVAFQQIISENAKKEASMAGEKNKKEGEAFLVANGKKEGVKTTESGLQYRILKSGEGKTPGPTDQVTTHYEGKLINGTIFDSSLKRNMPATFGVNQVIKGWTEALQLMKEGDEWELTIPSGLAYGERGAGADIGPNSTLIFYIKLIKVE